MALPAIGQVDVDRRRVVHRVADLGVLDAPSHILADHDDEQESLTFPAKVRGYRFAGLGLPPPMGNRRFREYLAKDLDVFGAAWTEGHPVSYQDWQDTGARSSGLVHVPILSTGIAHHGWDLASRRHPLR